MSKLGDRVYNLFSESTITQSLLVLTVFGSIAFCIITDRTIPEVLNQYGMVIVGFFFGAKSVLNARKVG